MRRLRILLLLVAFTACAPPSRSFVIVQNGLEVTTTVRRDAQHRDLRIITVRLRDAVSRKPMARATVTVQPAGAKVIDAASKGGGFFEAALYEPPGSSADIGIVVLAAGKSVIFRLQRQ